jgi:hypothetical protein
LRSLSTEEKATPLFQPQNRCVDYDVVSMPHARRAMAMICKCQEPMTGYLEHYNAMDTEIYGSVLSFYHILISKSLSRLYVIPTRPFFVAPLAHHYRF